MKFQRYIEKNWLFILMGLWLEAKAIDVAYGFRGYKALGSEFLVLPVFLLLIVSIRKLWLYSVKTWKLHRREADV